MNITEAGLNPRSREDRLTFLSIQLGANEHIKGVSSYYKSRPSIKWWQGNQ